jgi:hypothetical protein
MAMLSLVQFNAEPTRRAHIEGLAKPVILWAGAFAAPKESVIRKLAGITTFVLHGKLPKTSSRTLRYSAALREQDDLEFATDTAILRTFMRHLLLREKPLEWMQHLPQCFRESNMMDWSPRLRLLFDRQKWTFDPEHMVISWHEDAAERFYRIGYDALTVLSRIRREAWAAKKFLAEKRVFGSFKRIGASQDTATGLTLPPPRDDEVLNTVSQAKLFRDGYDHIATRNAAVAAGISVWHCKASVQGAGIKLNENAQKCMCNKLMPSMPHLMWVCPATDSCRVEAMCPLPKNRCEERLLCRTVPPRPPPVAACSTVPVLKDRFVRWLANEISYFENEDIIAIGTDGGAADGVSAWGCALRKPGYAEVVSGEDDTNVTAELAGIHAVLRALVAIFCTLQIRQVPACGLFDIIVDCKPAIALAMRTTLPCSRWRYCDDISQSVVALKAVGLSICFLWVPSHGKEVHDWRPDVRLGEKLMRELNDAADEACTCVIKPLRELGPRRKWVLANAAAELWSALALKLAKSVYERYDRFLRGYCRDVDTVSD